MRHFVIKYISLLSWLITIAVIFIALVAWWGGVPFRNGFSTYGLFPLFGLIAFSTMWAHYVAAALRKFAGLPKEQLSVYFETTSFIALIAFLAHPGLLIWQLWNDGFGLPPDSYLSYVGPSLSWAVLLGSLSLFIFLFYELRRWFSKKPWWKFVQYASDAAMIAIYIHALQLGGQLAEGQWFRAVWLVYGCIYIVTLIYLHTPQQKARN